MGWQNWWSRWADRVFGDKLQGAKRRSRRAQETRYRPRLEPLEVRNLLTAVPQMLADVYHVGNESSNPGDFTDVAGTTYFTANDGVHGRALWKSDGTSAGSALVATLGIGGGQNFAQLTNVNGTLFFVKTYSGSRQQELWRTDGTSGGLIQVATGTSFDHLTNFNGALYLSGSTGQQQGLFRVDRTSGAQPTLLVGSNLPAVWYSPITNGNSSVSISPTVGDWQYPSINMPTSVTSPLVVHQGRLYFLTGEVESSWLTISGIYENAALYSTDGTSSGTTKVREFNSLEIGTELVSAGNQLFFRAREADGSELWASDGTSSGTHLVRDINLGSDSFPQSIVALGNRVVFSTTDNVHGAEIWVSDGTSAGTNLLADVAPGQFSGVYQPRQGQVMLPFQRPKPQIVGSGNTAYFVAEPTSMRFELWRTDGTSAGTYQVLDHQADDLTVVANDLYFTEVGSFVGKQLSTIAGGQSSSTVVSTTPSLLPGSTFANLVNVNGRLFFAGHDSTRGMEVWSTDGTSQGTALVADVNVVGRSSNPSRVIDTIGGRTIFVATDENGESLWSSDGTPGGLVRLTLNATVRLTPASSSAGTINMIFTPLTSLKDAKFFRSGDVIYYMVETGYNKFGLFRTDGTAAGTYLILDHVACLATGSTLSMPGSSWSNPDIELNFTEVGGAAYFQARDQGGAVRLWRTDGTIGGTVTIYSPSQYYPDTPFESFSQLNGKLYFVVRPQPYNSGPFSLWESDGTSAGTHLVTEITGFTYGSQLHAFDGKLYFLNGSAATGSELWTSDGTSSGTHLVHDINPGVNSSNISVVGNKNGYLYFSANDGQHGRELWRTNGTSSGTTLVVDLTIGSESSDGKFTAVGDRWLYTATIAPPISMIAATGEQRVRAVWINEDSTGSVSLFELPQAVNWRQIKNVTPVGSKVVFYAEEPLVDFNTVVLSDQASNYLDGPVYNSFHRPLTNTVWKLYVSDGTVEGPFVVATKPYQANENIEIAVIGSQVYFVQNGDTNANDGTTLVFQYPPNLSGTEVWGYDTNLPRNNTVGLGLINPRAISDIAPGPLNSAPGLLTVIDGKLYFAANDPQYGRELFVYTPGPQPPSVSLDIDRTQINENGGSATIRVMLSATQSQDVVVSLDGGSRLGSDYSLSASTISIPAGQLSASLQLTAIDDSLSEPTETVAVRIASVSPGINLDRAAVNLQIRDNDRFVLSQGTLTINGDEGGNVIRVLVHNYTDTLDVTIDGETQFYNRADITRLVLHGNGGVDSLVFLGNNYTEERLSFTPTGFTGWSDTVALSADNFEQIDVQGQYRDTGFSTRVFPMHIVFDTWSFAPNSNADTVQVTPTSVTMSGPGYRYQLVGDYWTTDGGRIILDPLQITGDRVSLTNGIVTVNGTSGDDQITIDRSNPLVLRITVNGETSTIPVSSLSTTVQNMNVIVDGLGGQDNYRLVGLAGTAELVTLGASGVYYRAGTVLINANNVENAQFQGQAEDSANFSGSVGKDTFYGFPTYAILSGPGYQVQANNCGDVLVGLPGNESDVAIFYGSDSDDTFTAEKRAEWSPDNSHPARRELTAIVEPDIDPNLRYITLPAFTAHNYTVATLQGTGYRHVVYGFSQIYAFASSGNDTAAFTTTQNVGHSPLTSLVGGDTSPTAIFYGLAPYSILVDSGFLMQAIGFDQVTATNTTAIASSILYDSPGNDTYLGEYKHSAMSSASHSIDARGFRYNLAIRNAGGTDTADLHADDIVSSFASRHTAEVYDTTGSRDILVVYPGSIMLHFGLGGYQNIVGFRDVTTTSSSNDQAYFFDSAGNDQLQITGREAKLIYSDGATIRARMFDFVHANSSAGGIDVRTNSQPSWLHYHGNWRTATTPSNPTPVVKTPVVKKPATPVVRRSGSA